MYEKRKHLRFPLTATVRIVQANGATLHAYTININRGGIGLYSDSAINEGVDVRLEIMFKDIRGKSMTEISKGKIVFTYKWHWIYIMGVKFHKLLNNSDVPYLYEYIENCERIMQIFNVEK